MYVPTLYPNWGDQYDRMLRWYKKFEEIDRGKIDDSPNYFSYHDEVYAFFQNCHHLKDWTINDAKVSLPKNVVEQFINRNEYLKICADICNGTKHLKLDKSRSKISPKIEPSSTTIRVSEKGQIHKIKYTIETTSGIYDAFKIATECVEKWKEFIEEHLK